MADADALFQLCADFRGARRRANAAFETWRRQHARHLPHAAVIEHVGATSIEGCETKGDLDILIRVGEDDYLAARTYLDRTHKANDSSACRPGFSAFRAPGYALEVSVQLVASGDPLDRFTDFRDALIADRALLARYNALKRAYRGRPMTEYREAKSDFVRMVLGCA